jgi:hypothetical protein
VPLHLPTAPARGEAGARRDAPGRHSVVANEDGILVLRCLIAIILVLAIGVLLGKVLRVQYSDDVPVTGREVRWARRDVDVTYGVYTTGHLARGDSAWVEPVDGGLSAVFAGKATQGVVGFVPNSVLRPRR